MSVAISPLKIGVLACERFVHTKGIWGPIIHPESGQRFSGSSTRMTRMVLSHAWDIDRKGAEAFARLYQGVEVVGHYADMVGEVDGVILDDFSSCLHYKHLARPYLEAGVPMFINRPFALNLQDARELIELARKYDTPIMSGSSFEYAPEVEHVRREVEQLGTIGGYVAANSMSDYATHGIHGLWFVHACMGGGIRKVAYQTPDWRTPNGIVSIEYEGRDGGKPFYGCVQETTGTWGWIRVFGARSFEQLVHSGLPFWVPMVLEMQKLFETRKAPQSYEALYEKVQLFLAGFKSHVACAGAPVGLSEIGDWTAPLLQPDPYPEGYFD